MTQPQTTGLHTTTPEDEYNKGLAAGQTERAKNMRPDALARRVKFDRERVETGLFDGRPISPSQRAYHRGRLDGMSGENFLPI